ncbi:MAG: hypothetical protein SP4CHLAM5_03700 [Chlamydiia bacterium]|nr:hypothetical protein [Chlamydiia bacterium]MCH9618244.1 hypothetical protein [Chlamydiia bacterium]MCH9624309.1 hypothetical protein [Chlamydiia bacterium]
MLRSLKKIRPKANKLLSFSANWKRSNRDLNTLLGEQIHALIEKETFPQAVELFFHIPMFKTVLKNLKAGSLWKNVYVFTDEDHHPPKEIQDVQDIAAAFQKVCSIAHYPNYPEDSLAKAKLLTAHIHDYLFLIFKLKRFKGKAAEKVKVHLLSRVRDFVRDLKKELKKDSILFQSLHKIPSLSAIAKISSKTISLEDIELTHGILARLNTLSTDENTGISTCHKILNQMHKQIELVFDAISKNAPFYLPFSIRKVVFAKMKEVKTTKALYNSLETLFNDSRYEIIETKQASHLQNVKEACTPLHILSKSLDEIGASPDLPEGFKAYYKNYYTPLKLVLDSIEEYNSQIGYFLAGFYETQVSYLLELLSNPPTRMEPADTAIIEQKLITFLETYARVKPELLQIDIKQAFTNEYIKELLLDDAKAYITNTFSYILPERNEDIFILLEKNSKEILTLLLKIYKTMDPSCFTAHLLKEKIKGLYLIDVPSFQLGWYLFGEIVSILYILSAAGKKDALKIIESFLIDIYQYPIFTVLLNAKRASLPKIFIKLQMI